MDSAKICYVHTIEGIILFLTLSFFMLAYNNIHSNVRYLIDRMNIQKMYFYFMNSIKKKKKPLLELTDFLFDVI